ncbi:hypothetical protein ACVNIS_11520 [Sphaerotilaceae bacterium SBD11-9]
MKTPSQREEPEATHQPAAAPALAAAEPVRSALDHSPRQVAQRRQIDAAFAGGAPKPTAMPETMKAGAESQSVQGMPGGALPIQRKWVPESEGIQRWEPVKDGFVWYFDEKHRLMSFAYQGERSQLSGDVLKEIGVWRAYGDWQLMGWGIEGFNETPTVMVKKEAYEATFGAYIETGKRRWAELEKAIKGGAGHLDPETQAARDWFFAEHYKTDAQRDGGESQIDSNYRFLPDRIKTMAGKGSYSNRYAPGKGVITADSNYALKTGEEYYNPKTGMAESFSNSEVLFQQWKLAQRGVDKPSTLRTVERRHVSGTGLPMVTVIQNWMHGEARKKEDLQFQQGTAGFFAMLAVPNVVSSIWLVRDHGRELGVSTIARIDLLKNKSIDIHFA